MSSCKAIMITSCKGGVGKSTICANLGYTLARRGAKVLLVDLDLGMRCLDLILGLEDRALYDISDVVNDAIPLEKAIVSRADCDHLFFCAAPYRNGVSMPEDRFSDTLRQAGENLGFDYILVDTPGDVGHPFALACSVCDAALIVASHNPTTIRAAEHTGRMLSERGVENSRLIINNYDIRDKKGISAGQRAGVLEIIDRTYLRLIGVIPYDASFARAQERAELVSGHTEKNVFAAFDNIARRIEGEQVVLFDHFRKISRKKLM